MPGVMAFGAEQYGFCLFIALVYAARFVMMLYAVLNIGPAPYARAVISLVNFVIKRFRRLTF